MSKAVKSDFIPVVKKRKSFENDKSPATMSKAVKSDFIPAVKKCKSFENDKSPVGRSEELEVAQNSDTQDIVEDQRGTLAFQTNLGLNTSCHLFDAIS